MLTTLGKFVMDVATSSDRKHVLSAQDSERARRELSSAVAPRIEEIRMEQRKVFEESKALMVY
jgi:glucuronate isomerase